MTNHEFSIRKEERLAIDGREVKDWAKEDAYPCKAPCTAHQHTGSTVYLYAHCSCGWESFVGDPLRAKEGESPLRRRKPTTWFVNSMSDLFHESLNPAHRYCVFDAMLKAGWHTYQILTKRSENMAAVMAQWQRIIGPPPTNWWFGVSVESRKYLNRLDHLRATPAAVRFVSFEPLLEGLGPIDLTGIDWAIIGGESGPGARPCDVQWIRNIVRQCRAAGVRCFVKQLGSCPWWDGIGRPPASHIHLERDVILNGHVGWALDCLRDKKGGDPAEWPEDLRVRETPRSA